VLHFIGDYPFDLFKVPLIHLIENLIKYDVEKFAIFLEKRVKQPQFLKNVTEGKNKNKKVYIFTSEDLWLVDDNDLRKRVRVDDPDKGPIEIKVLDIPYLHLHDKNVNAIDNLSILYEELQETDSLTIFENGSIKALIEVQFETIKPRIFFLQLCPYIVFIIILLFYTGEDMNSYITNYNNDEKMKAYKMKVTILLFVCYFLILEVLQIITQPLKYFKNFWNIMDIMGFFLIILSEIIQIPNLKKEE